MLETTIYYKLLWAAQLIVLQSKLQHGKGFFFICHLSVWVADMSVWTRWVQTCNSKLQAKCPRQTAKAWYSPFYLLLHQHVISPSSLSLSLINVVTIPASRCPSSVVEYNTLMLEGRQHTHSGPPPVHILYAWRVKICKASLSSKQKLQGNIGQLSELKCIPGDMSFFLFSLLSHPHFPTVPTVEIGFSIQFSSNYTALFWPDAGPSHSNMDKHLWLFRIW